MNRETVLGSGQAGCVRQTDSSRESSSSSWQETSFTGEADRTVDDALLALAAVRMCSLE